MSAVAEAKVPGAEYGADISDGMTVFLWGHPGSWKTTWAAQWPGVLFLSIKAEGGDDALKKYPQIIADLQARSQIKDCPVAFNMAKPPVFQIGTAKEMSDKIEEVCLHHKAWGVCTVVVDSLTTLVDLWIDDFIQHQEKTNPGWRKRVEKQGGDLMGPPEWGMLGMYLRGLRVKLSNEGLNVIWTCLANEKFKPRTDNSGKVLMGEQELEKIEPLLQGKSKVTLPAVCKLHIYADRSTKIAHPTAMGRLTTQPTFWTASSDKVELRHKYYNQFAQGYLNDPEFGSLPTFRAVWAELHPYIYVGKR